jgi:hypothetical protein
MADTLLDRFASVAEDLDHLGTEWFHNPPDAVVRRGSVILRRFLAEGVLQRAWKAFGFQKEPTVVAPNLDLILGADRRVVEIATAGGADIGGTWAAGAILYRSAVPPMNQKMPDNALEYPFRLSEFTESVSAFIGGDVLVRREIVKYFAHFEGGAHLHLSSRVRKGEDELVRRVTNWQPRFYFNERDGLYTELLAIGQCVGKSTDLRNLAETIRSRSQRRDAVERGA